MSFKSKLDTIKAKDLFFGFFFFTVFIFTSGQIDNFFALGWLYLSILLFIFDFFISSRTVINYRNYWLWFLLFIHCLTHPIEFDLLGNYIVIFYFLSIHESYFDDPVNKKILKITINMIYGVWAFIIILSTINLFYLGYSHLNTYSAILYFPHRNLALEYGVLFTYVFIKVNNFTLQKSLLIYILYLIIVLLFQAKAALLSVILLLITKYKKMRPVFLSLIIILCFINYNNFNTYLTDKWTYFKELEKEKPIKKNLDIIYNVCYSGSASDRINTWHWTINNFNILGHGIGTWKINSMGMIKLNEGKTIVHRRPHNDFLWVIYELGWIGYIIIILFTIKLYRYGLMFFLPNLLFSFPFERAEFLSLLIFIAIIPIHEKDPF